MSGAGSPLGVAGQAQISAQKSGAWNDPKTWGGKLPQQGERVLIPSGQIVTVQSQIDIAFKSIRIAGTLRFSPEVDTRLKVEYLVSESTGTLEIGRTNQPIAKSAQAELIVADLGGTSTQEDPERFAPGVILMGPVHMHGQNKSTWTTLAAPALTSSRSLTLSQAPDPGKQKTSLSLLRPQQEI